MDWFQMTKRRLLQLLDMETTPIWVDTYVSATSRAPCDITKSKPQLVLRKNALHMLWYALKCPRSMLTAIMGGQWFNVYFQPTHSLQSQRAPSTILIASNILIAHAQRQTNSPRPCLCNNISSKRNEYISLIRVRRWYNVSTIDSTNLHLK